MRDYIVAVVAVVITTAITIFVAWVEVEDVQGCVERGHSLAWCFKVRGVEKDR